MARGGSVRGAESWLRALPSSCPAETQLAGASQAWRAGTGRPRVPRPAHTGLPLGPGQERVLHCHKYCHPCQPCQQLPQRPFAAKPPQKDGICRHDEVEKGKFYKTHRKRDQVLLSKKQNKFSFSPFGKINDC